MWRLNLKQALERAAAAALEREDALAACAEAAEAAAAQAEKRAERAEAAAKSLRPRTTCGERGGRRRQEARGGSASARRSGRGCAAGRYMKVWNA